MKKTTNEIWMPVPQSRGQYEASSLGRLRNIRTGRILRTYSRKNGSKIAHLNGYVGRTCTVSQVMGWAFFPGRKVKVCHIGDKGDDSLDNLEVYDYGEL